MFSLQFIRGLIGLGNLEVENKKIRSWFTLLISLGLIIRIMYANSSHDFWLDESLTFFLSHNSPIAILQATAYDNWPPLYSLLMHYWQKIDTSVFFLRVPSVVFGTVSLLLIYQISKKIFYKKIALIAITLGSFSPPLVYFSSENRPFALFLLLNLAMINSYLSIKKNSDKKNLILFILFATLASYTHYFALLSLLGLVLASRLTSFNLITKKNLTISILAVFLLLLPWLSYSIFKEKPACLCLGPLWGFFSAVAFMSGSGAGIVTLKKIFETEPQFLLRFLLLTYIFLSTFLFLYSVKFVRTLQLRFLYIYFSIPLLSILIISFFKPSFSPRSFIFLIPIFLIISAFSLDKLRKLYMIKLTVLLYVVGSIIALIITSQKPFQNDEPIKEMAKMLTNFPQKNLQIVHANLYTYLPAKFYNPNLSQYVLEQELPKPLLKALNTQVLNPYRTDSPLLLIYALDRTTNLQLQRTLIELGRYYGSPKEYIHLRNIKMILFEPKYD